MTRLMLLAAGAAALTLSACDRAEVHIDKDDGDGALRTISKLECPQTQGELTLQKAEADGTACAYTTEGAEVMLRLIALDGAAPGEALTPIEDELKALIPPPDRDAKDDSEKATEGSGDRAEIKLPGLHVRAGDHGANVTVGSIEVDADDGGATVNIGGSTRVNAGDNGAEIRTIGKGEGFRSTYILAADDSDNDSGYDAVGYEARGPADGPLVVAVVKARTRDHSRRDLFNDMKDLVELNVGD